MPDQYSHFPRVILNVAIRRLTIDKFFGSEKEGVGVDIQDRQPSYIHVCKRSDPQLENCIINSIESLRPYLLKGIPELQVPPIEPLRLPEVVVAQGGGIKAVGKDVDVGGPGSFIIKKLKLHEYPDKYEIDIGVDLPFLTFDGQYEVNGRLLVVPLNGKGPVHANATDCKADVVLHAQLVKRKNARYLHFNAMDIDLYIGNYYVKLENLFNGDRLLGDATNAALNENQKEFINYLKPIIETTVGNVILEIANRITQSFDFDTLLPE
ncbi:hypothetical protein L9F63_005985 [Diploptera punctata]|uniref:Protein takeout n=1 Tax=Diploptera punctata TaxID=6984 RepID=A0AAD8E5F8_DIPPU|nr:hypothetical protein L9F63_005985 [Diploptera punctata]